MSAGVKGPGKGDQAQPLKGAETEETTKAKRSKQKDKKNKTTTDEFVQDQPRADDLTGPAGKIASEKAIDVNTAQSQFKRENRQAIEGLFERFPPPYYEGMLGGGIQIYYDVNSGEIHAKILGEPKDTRRAELIRKQFESWISNNNISLPPVDSSTAEVELYVKKFF